MSDLPNDIIGAALEQFDRDAFKDGDLISHDWLKWALDIPEPETVEDARKCQFIALARVEDFKDRLLTERQIALQTVRGEGYRVVPPKEQASFAAETAVGYVEKGLRVGRRLISNTRMSLLSTEERRRHDDTAAKMDSFRQMVRRERKVLFAPAAE